MIDSDENLRHNNIFSEISNIKKLIKENLYCSNLRHIILNHTQNQNNCIEK